MISGWQKKSNGKSGIRVDGRGVMLDSDAKEGLEILRRKKTMGF